MDRSTRTLIVVLVAVLVAGLATYGVYRAIQQIPVRQVEVAHTFVVVANKTLPVGARVAATDLKLIPWPEHSPIPGAFAKPEAIVDRGVIAQVLENEPVTETKLAPVDAGAGLPPTIPQGMRAISVRVNEVVGVAGFVTPGTRVDVFVTLKQGTNDLITRAVVSNVQVLTAGTRYDEGKSKNGEAIPSSVVTLLLTPDDAARVVLASSDGQIMLALRNPLDVAPNTSQGARSATLFGAPPPAPVAPAGEKKAAPKRAPVVAAAPEPAPAPPPSKIYTVEAIRAAKRTEEAVR